MGKNVLGFEEEFPKYLGVKHAVSVGNGTDGRACALATIVTVFTVISLLIFNKISKDGEIML